MTTDLTDRIILQGRALVRAIEALGTIEPTGPFADGRLQAPPAGHRGSYAYLGKRGDAEHQ